MNRVLSAAAPLLAASVFAAVFVASGALAQELPPGHPPLDSEAAKRPAPPLDEAAMKSGQLPPGHPPMPAGGPGASAAPGGQPDALAQKLDALKGNQGKSKDFEAAVGSARVFYNHGRFGDAIPFLEEAVAKAEPTRSLYLEQKRKADAAKKPMPPAGTVGCVPGAEMNLEALSARAKEKAKAGESWAAASCARAALHAVAEAETMLAASKFLEGDAAGALKAYERVLKVFELHPEALYGRASILMDTRGNDVSALKEARASLETYLREYPTAPKAKSAKLFVTHLDEAIPLGGIAALNKHRAANPKPREEAKSPHAPVPGQKEGELPQITKEQMEFLQQLRGNSELQAKIPALLEEAEDFLSKGKYQDALNNYKQAMPVQPDNGRLRAGMAWSLVGLQKPMAERIWSVAVESDAAAVDKLGDTLKAKGDGAGAKALWSKLAQSAPSYATSAKLSDKLK